MMTNDVHDRPIFIVGPSRSGTTLLAYQLASHPAIAVGMETHFFSRWLRLFGSCDLATERGFDRFWRAFGTSKNFQSLGVDAGAMRKKFDERPPQDVQSFFTTLMETYAAAKGRTRWGEKTPRHIASLRTILDWYPAATILVMLRDSRAVVASLQKTPWVNPSIYAQAHEWNRTMAFFEEWHDDERVHPVRYEELVQDPERVLRAVCHRIGEPFSPLMLEHGKHAGSRDWEKTYRGAWDRAHAKRMQDPVTPARIDRWKHSLRPSQIALIESITRERMQRYGYQPVSDGKPGIMVEVASWVFQYPGRLRGLTHPDLPHLLRHPPPLKSLLSLST